MPSLSISELTRSLRALEGEITRAGQNVSLSPTTSFGRSSTRLRRLLSPNQIMRFPTEGEWTTFKEKFNITEDVYDIIEHTDPLGFDGPSPTFYSDGAQNPKNYLRRDQLPPMKIDMTSIYNPYITARMLTNDENDYFIPFLGNISEHYFPYVDGNGTKAIVKRQRPVVSSLTPKMWTCGDAATHIFTSDQYEGYYLSFVVSLRYQEIDRYKSSVPRLNIITSPTTTAEIPQTVDCSTPTVGCFWFNDGKNGQIELPKDPDCRIGIIIRFKKYVLL